MPQFSLLKAFTTVAGFNLLSRVLGFFREIITALVLGASPLADAYFIALRIPNLLRSIFAEGAFTSAFVPVFSTSFKENPERVKIIFGSVLGWMLLVTSILAILGIIFSLNIINFFAPGFITNSVIASDLLKILAPYITLVSLVILANGALNTVGVFGAAAFAQVLMNIVLIAGGGLAYICPQLNPAYVLAVSFIFGGIIQVIAQIPSLIKKEIFAFPTLNITPEVKQVGTLMLPAMFGAGAYQIFIFAQSLFASVMEPGSISWLSYSDRLIQLPLGIVSISLAQVLLPKLSVASSHSDFMNSLKKSVIGNILLMMPVAAFIWIFAPDLVRLMFQRGVFNENDTLKTASIVRISSIGIVFTSTQTILVRAFHAKKDTKTPALIGCFSLFIFILCCLMFMGPTVHNEGSILQTINYFIGKIGVYSLGVNGLALASVIATIISFIITIIVLIRLLKTNELRKVTKT